MFATRYTRHLDKNGFLRFQNWQLYGELGLAHAPVSVWVYDGSLKVEHRAITLSEYAVELDKQKHLSRISHPRLVETPFRSPQLQLFDLGPDEWLLYWRTPEVAPPRRRRRVAGLVQLPLFDLPEDLAVGADETGSASSLHNHLQLLPNPTKGQRPES